MKSAEIRSAFLNYFASQGHAQVASSSLVPHDDPTLLFTNAGMNQFKDTFLGAEVRDYNRAVSSQRCVRAGGKHNDLENVGYTARHHTFFEMLGNFSFGDYFKREAIQMAWAFLTEELKLPKEKLWVTVHISDDEAEAIWVNEIGVDPARLSRLDEDNFWQMGDTGPCGPSSEIFYDHGEDVPGGPPGSENDDLDRYIEIWNLVFMQYERQASGELVPLPNPSIDTGMGLERIAAVMQGVHNNYEIDLFQALLKAASDAVGEKDLNNTSLRVIADHIRSCSFIISDGVLPSNEGRGFVLRRIIRRAIRHGYKLGQKGIFFNKLVQALADEMGDAYPELREQQAHIEKVLRIEEEQFARTLEKGMGVFESELPSLKDSVIPGDLVFLLHDTYGFPADLTNDIARERGLTLDMEGYELAMNAQRERARAAGSFKVDYTDVLKLDGETEFTGYNATEGQGTVVAILVDGESVDTAGEGAKAVVVLDKTSFYGESGGQAGDCGFLKGERGAADVTDTTKSGDSHLHHVLVTAGELSVGDSVATIVDAEVRQATKLNHSATHLVHAALRKVLGDQVAQKGSLVQAERLRFDFSSLEAMTSEQILEVERMVNAEVRANTAVNTTLASMDQAQEMGAMMLFGEKYGNEVRVLSMGDGFSVELCGGTHVERTGDIGLFKIISEAGVAAGVRRIEAITGEAAEAWVEQQASLVSTLAAQLKAAPDSLLAKFEQFVASSKAADKEISALKSKLAASAGQDMAANAVEVAGAKVLVAELPGADPKSLRDLQDQLKNKLGDAVVFLAVPGDDKVSLIAGVSKSLIGKVKAGDLIKELAPIVGGKGGGRPDMAQGGGTEPAKISQLLSAANELIAGKLN